MQFFYHERITMKKLINQLISFIINKYTDKILIGKEEYHTLKSETCNLKCQVKDLDLELDKFRDNYFQAAHELENLEDEYQHHLKNMCRS